MSLKKFCYTIFMNLNQTLDFIVLVINNKYYTIGDNEAGIYGIFIVSENGNVSLSNMNMSDLDNLDSGDLHTLFSSTITIYS